MNTQRFNAKYLIQYPKKVFKLTDRKSCGPKGVTTPAYSSDGQRGLTTPYEIFLDKETMPETLIYNDTNWVKEQPADPVVLSKTKKPFDTILFFICNNPHDRTDFGATVTLTIGGQEYKIESTSVAYIPKNFEFEVRYDNVTKPTVFGVLGLGTNDFETKIPNCKYDQYDEVKEPVVTTTPFTLLEAEGHDFGDDGYIKNHTCPNNIYLGEEIKKGFPHFMDITWFWDIPYPNPHVDAHRHNTDELVMFISSDPDNNDLDGEVMFYLGEEPHFCRRTCAMYIPGGLKHAPMVHTRVNRPMTLVTLMVGAAAYEQ